MNRYLKIFPFLLTIFLRLPAFYEPHWYEDTGMYSAIGVALNHGAVLYGTVFDNKTPFIYYLYALYEHIPLSLTFVYQSVSLILALLTQYFIFKIAQLKFGNKVAVISSILFALLVGSVFLEGTLANAENYYMFFSVLSIYIILKNVPDISFLKLYIAGLIIGLGVMFKVSVIFDAFAVIVYFFFIFDFKKYFKSSFFYTLGLFTPLVIFLIYEFFIHNLSNAIYAIFLYNLGYVAKAKPFLGLSIVDFQTVLLFIILFISFVFYRKRKIKESMSNDISLFIYLWVIVDLYSVYLSGRPYFHYLLQIALPLCILLAYYIYRIYKDQWYKKILIVFIISVSIYLGELYFFKSELSWQIFQQLQFKYDYYPNSYAYMIGRETSAQYNSIFIYNTNVIFEKTEQNANIVYQIANTLNSLNVKGKRIFIMGNFPWDYYMTQSIPAEKYVVDFQIIGKERQNIVMSEIQKNKPYLILYYNDSYGFSKLTDFINRYYKLAKISSGAYFYIIKT
ncbi:MAG: ArnT family glycosyltransferase [Patescibacteria group bacterium]